MMYNQVGGDYMTKYEELMDKSDMACKEAVEFWKKGDDVMSAFWKNASVGYKEKALELKIVDNLD